MQKLLEVNGFAVRKKETLDKIKFASETTGVIMYFVTQILLEKKLEKLLKTMYLM